MLAFKIIIGTVLVILAVLGLIRMKWEDDELKWEDQEDDDKEDK